MILLQEDGPDFSLFFQAAIIFVLFVLPVLRGVVQSRKKHRELRESRRRGEAGEPPDKPTERKGLSDWERLLRGEQVGKERPKPPVFLEELFPELSEDEPPAPPVAPTPRPAPALAQRRERASEQSMEVGQLEGGLREREPHPEMHSKLQDAMATVGEADLTTLDDDRPRRSERLPRVRMHLDWRRAVALAEVLGQPVSMREGGAWPGAPRGL